MKDTPQVYMVSDVHLSEHAHPMTELFLAFLKGPAQQAQALYLLGDLFNYWVGDDLITPLTEQIAEALYALRKNGVNTYFLAGNRDFLIGSTWLNQAGLVALPELALCTLPDGTQYLLCHGDTLNRHDRAYLRYRACVHHPLIQRLFLTLPKSYRQRCAERLRHYSHAHHQSMKVPTPWISSAYLHQLQQEYPSVSGIIYGHIHTLKHLIWNDSWEEYVIGTWNSQQGSFWGWSPNTAWSPYQFTQNGLSKLTL